MNYLLNPNKKNINNQRNTNSDIQQYIFERGILFEKYIIDIIKENLEENELSFKCIMEDDKPIVEKYDEYLFKTKSAINDNIDIIYQGMIQTISSEQKFRGFPDLLVSKKAFKKLFYNFIDRDNNFIMLNDINFDKSINNYIIIDIKSSTIALNVDGKTARNSELLKLYKTQLSVYGNILNDNYGKKVLTYILPYELKHDYILNKYRYEHTIRNPLKDNKFCLVNIDIDGRDLEYYINLTKIYELYIKCITRKNPLNILFDEQIKELNQIKKDNNIELLEKIKRCEYLLPISKQTLDSGYSGLFQYNIPFVRSMNITDNLHVKQWIAKQTRSLSMLRGFNADTLLNLKKNSGLFSYLQDTNLILEESKIKKDYNLIESILRANKDEMLFCKSKQDKINEFNKKIMHKRFICCLDFETIPNKLLTNNYFNIEEYDSNNFNYGQNIFMIGCTIYENKNMKFKKYAEHQYILDDIKDDIYKEFLKLENDINSIKVNKADIAFIIWSPFEISTMKNINKLVSNEKFKFNGSSDNSLLFDIQIVDLMKIFSNADNPIGVNGAFDYSIKSIANGYLSNNYLDKKNYWQKSMDDSMNCTNGCEAMYYALWYYKDKNKYDKIFNNIKCYNMTDCSIMADIINITYGLLQ
jgi:hypothetical protein